MAGGAGVLGHRGARACGRLLGGAGCAGRSRAPHVAGLARCRFPACGRRWQLAAFAQHAGQRHAGPGATQPELARRRRAGAQFAGTRPIGCDQLDCGRQDAARAKGGAVAQWAYTRTACSFTDGPCAGGLRRAGPAELVGAGRISDWQPLVVGRCGRGWHRAAGVAGTDAAAAENRSRIEQPRTGLVAPAA